jgi:hypothetical protein
MIIKSKRVNSNKRFNRGLILIIILFLFTSAGISMNDKTLSNMNILQLKELGKQKLARDQYRDTVRIFNEIKKRYPMDLIFQIPGEARNFVMAPIKDNVSDSVQNQTPSDNQDSLGNEKTECDVAIILHCDVPTAVIEQLQKLCDFYHKIAYHNHREYEKCIEITTEMRKLYIDEPWTDEMLQKSDFAHDSKTEFSSEDFRLFLDLGTRTYIGFVLENQTKIEEAKKQYQEVLSMLQDEQIIKRLQRADKLQIKEHLEKEIDKYLKRCNQDL